VKNPIRYELGTGVAAHRKFGIVRWTFALAILFGVGVAMPRTLQHYGVYSPLPAKSSSTAVKPVSLKHFTQAELEVTNTTAVVETGLQSVIEQWTKRNSGQEWSVAVERLGDHPATASFNPNVEMAPASLYKLYLLQTLNEKIPFSQWGKKQVAGQSVRSCVDAMIRISDNACAIAIGDMVGLAQVDSRAHAMGLTNAKLNANGKPKVTASDTARLLGLLNDGRLIESDAQNFVLASMKSQKFRKGIPAGVKECDTYNKTGDLDGYRHDAAIVKCNGGVTYTVVIMSKGGSNEQIASLARSINNYLFSRR
jgi:hypothetical protein